VRLPRPEQDVIASIAEIAGELYAAESALHRAARIEERGTAHAETIELARRLAAITLARAAGRRGGPHEHGRGSDEL
jgi:alkylation response protein AidB-like acyl-CoA dehydrogenase